jgi:glutamyl-tRNA reductase
MAPSHPHRADRYLVVGANHLSSSLTLRDRLFIEDVEVPEFLAHLANVGIPRAIVISTCDRIDILTAIPNLQEAAGRIVKALAERTGMDGAALAIGLYTLTDDDAVRHVFATASSLDSQILGEPQILGQLKSCHVLARDAEMSSGELETLLQAAYGAAKRVRNETAIGHHPVSMAAAAVQAARDLHGNLANVMGVLIGAADMGVTIAEQFVAGGLGDLTVIHPREKRADAIARQLGCHVSTIDRMADAIADADIIISAIGTRRRVLDADMVRAAGRRRRHKPVLIIDAAVPGDVDPAVNRIDEAFLYDLDDLERVALRGLASRDAEADVAWRIIDEEVGAFKRGRAERVAVPVLTLLREHFEETRRLVLEIAPDEAEKASRLLINRLLHRPSETLRDMASGTEVQEQLTGTSETDWEAAERLLRHLFRLGGREPEIETAARTKRKNT